MNSISILNLTNNSVYCGEGVVRMYKKKLSLVIVASILVTSLTGINAYAVPEISDSQIKQIDDLNSKYDENENNILDLESSVQKLDNDLSILTIKVKATEEEIVLTNEKLKTEGENLKKAEDLMDNRMREMYKNSTTSVNYLEFIAASDNLGDFISRINCANKLAETDRKSIENIQNIQADIEKSQKEQEDLQDTQKKQKSELEGKKTELNSKLEELVKIRNLTLGSIKEQEDSMVDPLLAIANSESSATELNSVVSALEKLKDKIKTPETITKIKNAIESTKTKIKNLPKEPVVPKESTVPKESSTPGKSGAKSNSNNAVVIEAYKYLGIPYLWGGDNPSTGMDCSGFTSYVYRQLGYEITRTTFTQVTQGTEVEVSLDKLKPGDLLFFGDKSAPHHVAIYIGNNMYIHAPQTGDVIKVSSGALRACTARRIIN